MVGAGDEAALCVHIRASVCVCTVGSLISVPPDLLGSVHFTSPGPSFDEVLHFHCYFLTLVQLTSTSQKGSLLLSTLAEIMNC